MAHVRVEDGGAADVELEAAEDVVQPALEYEPRLLWCEVLLQREVLHHLLEPRRPIRVVERGEQPLGLARPRQVRVDALRQAHLCALRLVPALSVYWLGSFCAAAVQKSSY